jgi:hypothetical protein
MLKNYEEKPILCSLTGKKDILCGLRKKDKNMSRKKLFQITENYYFYTAHKKCRFFAKLSG